MSSLQDPARRPQVLDIFRAGYPSAADGGGGTLHARARGQIAAMARAYQVALTAGGGTVGARPDRCCSLRILRVFGEVRACTRARSSTQQNKK